LRGGELLKKAGRAVWSALGAWKEFFTYVS